MNIRLIVQATVLFCILLHLHAYGMLFQKYEKPGSLNHKNICQALEISSLGCQFAQKAIDSFCNKCLENFDVGVGDNLCQIRAFFVLKMAQTLNNEILDGIKHSLAQADDQIKNLYTDFKDIGKDHKLAMQISKELKQKTISQFLHLRGIPIPAIDEELMLLMMMYAAKQCYAEIDNELKTKIIEQYKLSLTINFFKDLVVSLRKELSKGTVHYLCSLGDVLLQQGIQFLHDEQRFDRLRLLRKGLSQCAGNALFEAPATYIGVALLVEGLCHYEIPVVIRTNVLCNKGVHQHLVAFEIKDGDFFRCNDFDCLQDKPIYLIDGITNLTNQNDKQAVDNKLTSQQVHQEECDEFSGFVGEIVYEKLRDILLANAAMHAQFLQKDMQIDFSKIEGLKKEFFDYQKLALERGLCMENMRLLRITHIYPSITNRIVKGMR